MSILNKKVRARVLMADGYNYPTEPANGKSFSMRELQEIVGGTFDIQRLPKTGGRIVVRDDGKLVGLPVNEQASELWRTNYPLSEYPENNDGTIVGNVLVCDGRMIR